MNTGWMCPRCQKVNAPFVKTCDCLPEQQTEQVNPSDYKWEKQRYEGSDRPHFVPDFDPRCTCHGPWLLYIPPEGTYITCPVHGKKFIKPAVRFYL